MRAISRAAMTMVVTACGRPGGRLCGQPGGLMTVIFCPDFSRDLWCDVSKEFGGPCGEAKHLIETAKAERRLPKRKGEEVGARVRQR